VRTLTTNGVQLLDRIVADVAFVDELGSVGCITWPQREHIINIVQPRDRNDKLLEFLTRRSVADFQKFISVLAKEQAHLVPLLLTDGGDILRLISMNMMNSGSDPCVAINLSGKTLHMISICIGRQETHQEMR